MKLLMTADTNRILRFPPPCSTNAAFIGDEALLGPSTAIARVWSQIRRVAPHFRAAIVTGEPGCGAEAAARSMHALSPVSNLPFIILEAADADELLSASASHMILEGLIFLPDIDKLTPAAQRGLIRKLRIRGRTPLRIVAASGTELRACVSAGRFSAELAELLGAVRIALPPLRERPEDIPLLATHLVQRIAERLGLHIPVLAAGFHTALITFPWPGNITQLDRTLAYLLADSDSDTFNAEDFAAAVASIADTPSQQ
ncbi:MAG TPA: sigma 54-interacting transcriptional regulator, partial [Acidobacteriaceae bacterium]|nr:sigma 54-interacting transcriptional regulator [Acidobacteriaceae bacterium]